MISGIVNLALQQGSKCWKLEKITDDLVGFVRHCVKTT
jgi:hypothetical protein